MKTRIHTAVSLAALGLVLTSAAAVHAGGVAIHALPMAATTTVSARPITVQKAPGAAAEDAIPAAVADELSHAQPFPKAQVRGTHYRSPNNCRVDTAELTTPLVASGRAAMRVSGLAPNGKPCKAYAFVDVRVTTDALVASKPIREGAPLEGSVRMVRREIVNGEAPLTQLPDGALASRSLAPGQLIEQAFVRPPGLNPGSSIRVLVRSGSLSLEEIGRVTRCPDQHDATRACAQVSSGKRVEGLYQGGAILVETP